MNEDLTRSYRRWIEAEEGGAAADPGDLDAADAACRAMFAGVASDPPASVDFTARTMTAIAAAACRDARRARRTRKAAVAGGVAAGAVAVYAGGAWALAAVSTVFIGVLNLFVDATVSIATGMQTGADIWSVLASIGRAVAAFVAEPTVTISVLALQGVALAALVALQRLLGSDTESFK